MEYCAAHPEELTKVAAVQKKARSLRTTISTHVLTLPSRESLHLTESSTREQPDGDASSMFESMTHLPRGCAGQRGEEHHGGQHREGAREGGEDRAAGRQDRQPPVSGMIPWPPRCAAAFNGAACRRSLRAADGDSVSQLPCSLVYSAESALTLSRRLTSSTKQGSSCAARCGGRTCGSRLSSSSW